MRLLTSLMLAAAFSLAAGNLAAQDRNVLTASLPKRKSAKIRPGGSR